MLVGNQARMGRGPAVACEGGVLSVGGGNIIKEDGYDDGKLVACLANCTYTAADVKEGLAAQQCPAPQPQPSNGDDKMRRKLILIVALSIGGLMVLGFVFCLYRRHKKSQALLDYHSLNAALNP